MAQEIQAGGGRREAGRAGRATPRPEWCANLPASQNLGLVTAHSMVTPKITVCRFRKCENCKA